jgi:drug/metabolite transporter (DMT)-like permease
MSIHRSMSLADWGQLVLLSVVWGGSYLFVGLAVQELPPPVIVLARVAIGGFALVAVAGLSGMRLPLTVAWWLPITVMSILNNIIPWNLITWAQTEVPSGLAAIFNAATPLFTVLLAQVLTADEKMTVGKLAGVVLGLAGVAVLIGPSALAGARADLWAQAALLAAAMSYALSGIWARRFSDRPPLATAAGQMVASTVMMIPITLALVPGWTPAMPGPPTIVSVLCLALLSTAFGYLLVFRIVRSAGATNLSLVTLLIPVTAVLLGVVVLDESLDARAGVGMALIALGLTAIDGRIGRRLSRALRRGTA